MTGADTSAEIAALKSRLANLEAPRSSTSAQPPVSTRRVSVWLALGIFILPYVFAWFLLRAGYSQLARALGFGWLVLLVITIGASSQLPKHDAPGEIGTAWTPVPADPKEHEKSEAVFLAKTAVPKVMKDPDSAQFGSVWGVGSYTACGFVNGKNSFGALTGEQRFIYLLGQVEFESQLNAFARHWNALCIERAASKTPTGVLGKHWGSKPTDDLKAAAPPTDEGLSLYVPKQSPPPLEGVSVKESDYQFDHRKLYEADFYIDGEKQGNAIKDALIKKYGRPQEFDDTARSYKWIWSGQKFHIAVTYDAKFTRTSVSYVQSK